VEAGAGLCQVSHSVVMGQGDGVTRPQKGVAADPASMWMMGMYIQGCL
jgi:hypothetical protein